MKLTLCSIEYDMQLVEVVIMASFDQLNVLERNWVMISEVDRSGG